MSRVISLKPMEKKDLEFIRRLRNENRQYFFDSNYVSKQDQQRWYKNYLLKTDDQMFILENNGIPVGCGAIYHIDRLIKTAEIGRFVIDKLHRGKGYSRILISMIENIAFLKFGIQTLCLEVLSNNILAISLYERMRYRKIKNPKRTVIRMIKPLPFTDIIQSPYVQAK